MTRTEVEDCKKINIDWLLRKNTRLLYFPNGQITWTSGENKSSVGYCLSLREGDSYLRLYYTNTNGWTGEKKDFDYSISITKIQCRYGGCRYYFLCSNCSRRISTLYLSDGIFSCRKCQNLIYHSQKENRKSGLFSALDSMIKSEEYLEKVKRWSYKGNLTRRAKVYLKKADRTNYLSLLVLGKKNKNGRNLMV